MATTILLCLPVVLVGGVEPPGEAADCGALSSGGVVMQGGSAMIVGQPVAGIASNANYRAHFGAIHCLQAGAAGQPCEGNFNGDDVVDATDLALLLGSWGPCPGCAADLNGDDVVDATDLALLLGNWGPCI